MSLLAASEAERNAWVGAVIIVLVVAPAVAAALHRWWKQK